MDDYIINLLNCPQDTSAEQVSMNVESLLYAYKTLEEYAINSYVKEIAKKRINNIELHCSERVIHSDFKNVDLSDNGLGKHYNNAINMMNRGLNEFNCSNALRELLEAIKDEPHNIMYQTLIQLISEAERSNR